MKWEYKTIKEPTTGFTGGKLDENNLDNRMNLLGGQGWELVNLFDTNLSQGATRDVVAVFKRQKQE
jgi:hypothetical protein